MKKVIDKTRKAITQTVLCIVVAIVVLTSLYRIYVGCSAIAVAIFVDKHKDMPCGGYFIPHNHLDLLMRKKISGRISSDCMMVFGITGMFVNYSDAGRAVEYETVRMGRYPQKDTLEESIEWFIIDEKCGRTLLLSKYYLDAKPYDDRIDNVSWEMSGLRRWLNVDFYHSAFDQQEQKTIEESVIGSDLYVFSEWQEEVLPSRITKDKLFVLDPHEKLIYLKMTGNGYFSEPTEYAIQQLHFNDETADWIRFGAVENIACQKCWSSWLADPEGPSTGDYCLKDVVAIDEDSRGPLYVRPAVWVDSGYIRKLKKQE